MASLSFARRVLYGCSTTMFLSATFPVAMPHSSTALKAIGAQDTTQLEEADPFVIHAREIAKKLGVRHPENVNILLDESDGEGGGALGADLVGRASIWISKSVYRGFYQAPSEESTVHDLEADPAREEVDFILAHECAHIANNHSIKMTSFIPISMLSSYAVATKVPNKLLGAVLGFSMIAGGGLYLSWHMEHEADHIAAALGKTFREGGLSTFERSRTRNCFLKSYFDTRMITKDGNYLGDTSHPWLTTRIHHLEHMECEEHDHACIFCSWFTETLKKGLNIVWNH
ncbi:metalloprotease family M48X [Thraustotheca clavata]|uniref:Metalloprotease family M48X n=1 Tax=Thraustotheca clavata TaxID=74557 RepID=A0A1V9ZHY6_9STRA|nr:metalloprotease family M48X [Thraustotheca clavata]